MSFQGDTIQLLTGGHTFHGCLFVLCWFPESCPKLCNPCIQFLTILVGPAFGSCRDLSSLSTLASLLLCLFQKKKNSPDLCFLVFLPDNSLVAARAWSLGYIALVTSGLYLGSLRQVEGRTSLMVVGLTICRFCL